MSLDQIQPAGKAEVIVYSPYYPRNKHPVLPTAIGLYQKGSMEGSRKIQGGENIPFVASWLVTRLPSEITQCRLQFNGQAELSYAVSMSTHEFVDFLIEVLQNFRSDSEHIVDFPQTFYKKLLQAEEKK